MGRKVLGWGDIIGSGVLVERHNGKRGAGGETYWGERCWWGGIIGRRVSVRRHSWEKGTRVGRHNWELGIGRET